MNNKFDRFTEDARQSLVYAQEYAFANGAKVIDTAFMILGFLKVPESAAAEVLNEFDISDQKVKDIIVPGQVSLFTPLLLQKMFMVM